MVQKIYENFIFIYLTKSERLASYAPFFKELDGKISENSPAFDDLMNKTNSLVIEALTENLKPINESTPIPKLETSYFWFTDHPECA